MVVVIFDILCLPRMAQVGFSGGLIEFTYFQVHFVLTMSSAIAGIISISTPKTTIVTETGERPQFHGLI